MIRSRIVWIFGLMVLLPFLFTCGTGGRVANNFSDLYKPESSHLHPDFTVFHVNDSISRLYFRINTKELLYAKKEGSEEFFAKVKVELKLYSSWESASIKDTASTMIFDRGNLDENRSIVGYLEFKAAKGSTYQLMAFTKDIYRDQELTSYVQVDKRKQNSRQSFLVLSTANNMPIFRKNIFTRDKLKIQCNQVNTTTLHGRFYKRNFPLAPPPFSVNNPKPLTYEADSTFRLTVSGGYVEIDGLKEGIYHFQYDSTGREGLTLYNFHTTFPEVRKMDQMVPPMRYITTKKEYNTIMGSADKKAAVDKFWLNNAATPERARELIRNYYNRVKAANTYFTSYVEGWKSDRGMIYTVFGPPNIIYKGSSSETWVYGEEGNFMSLNFSFLKVDNPFTDNDYQLNRTPVYKSNWYRAVDSWRSGRVFTIN